MDALYIALVSGTLGLSGALLSQLISARFNLKAKRIELFFARKADAYKALMEKAGAFASDSQNPGKYMEFIHAYYATMIVASPAVIDAFSAQENVTEVTSRLLKGADDVDERERMKASWLTAMNKLIDAMREDLSESARR